jgi:glycogen operon protein
VLAFHRAGPAADGPDVVYAALNMHWENLEFGLPQPPPGLRWHVSVNTAMPSPEDVWEPGRDPVLDDQDKVWVGGRSIVVLVAR